MKAGAGNLNRGRVLVPAGMNEVWRIFCLSIAIGTGTKPIELYECRGTSFIVSRSQVKVYKVLKEALVWSRYRHYKSVMSAGAPACPAYRQAGGRQELQKM